MCAECDAGVSFGVAGVVRVCPQPLGVSGSPVHLLGRGVVPWLEPSACLVKNRLAAKSRLPKSRFPRF